MLNFQLFLILLAALLIFSFGVASVPIAGVDEGRFTQASLNMLTTGDWFIPQVDGILRLEKPILFYWEQAVSFLIFGTTEFAARLPSVLSAIGLVALAYFMGGIQGTPLIAGLICLSTLFINIFAKIAMIDMSLCLLISATLSFFFLSYFFKTKTNNIFNRQNSDTRIYFYLASFSAALGFLCKGPIALVLPSIIIFIFLLKEKELIIFFAQKKYDSLICVGMFFLINIPWYLFAHIRTNGEFTKSFFLGDNLGRFLETTSNHGGAIWFYIPVILIGFFPWSFFLIQALFNDQNSSKVSRINIIDNTNTLRRFNLIWIAVTFIFFSLSQTKLITYILPISLPLILTIAKYWSTKMNAGRGFQNRNYDILGGFLALFIAFPICLLIILDKLSDSLNTQLVGELQFFLVVIGIFFSCTLIITMTSVKTNLKLSFGLILIFSLGLYLFSMELIAKPLIRSLDGGIKSFCTEIYVPAKEHAGKHKIKIAKLASYKLNRASIGFYCHDSLNNLNDINSLNKFLVSPRTSHRPVYLIVKNTEFKNISTKLIRINRILRRTEKYTFLKLA
jgi:4-amino-4-deoxy-L-arabinose transferase-like glycosyltransferase